jgi:hypothetical protein
MPFQLFLALPLAEALPLAFPEALPPNQSAQPLYLFFSLLLISILIAVCFMASRALKVENKL